MADKKPAKIIETGSKQSAAASPQEKKKIPAKFFDVEPEERQKMSWKTFIIPAILILILVGFFVSERFFADKGKFPEPNITVEMFILEVKNLPVVKDNKVVAPNPMPDFSQFVSKDDYTWFLNNYKKLAFVAVSKDVKAYNYLNDDEKKIMALLLLVKDCPSNPIRTQLNLKKLYNNADFSFRTNDNLTYYAKLVKEGLNWKIVGWFGARNKWDAYIAGIQLPE